MATNTINADEGYTPLKLPGCTLTLGGIDYEIFESTENDWELVIRDGDATVDTILRFFDATMEEDDADDIRDRLAERDITSMYLMWAFQKLVAHYRPLIGKYAQGLGEQLAAELGDEERPGKLNREGRRRKERSSRASEPTPTTVGNGNSRADKARQLEAAREARRARRAAATEAADTEEEDGE